jgi:hypothetical protein
MKTKRPTFNDFKNKALQNLEIKEEYEAISEMANKMVTAQELIDTGIPRAVFWNNDLSKEVPSDIFIIATLKRSYTDFIIEKFIEFFGEDIILSALLKHRENLSDQLFHTVVEMINGSKNCSE